MNWLKYKIERRYSPSVRMYKIGKRLSRRLRWQMFRVRVKIFFFNRKIERRKGMKKHGNVVDCMIGFMISIVCTSCLIIRKITKKQ